MGRRTVTSCEVKDRWNREHYDQIQFRTGNGGREAIQTMAAMHGLSVAAYIRHLVIEDAKATGNGDISAILGGGGELKQWVEACFLRQLPIPGL